MFYNKLPNNFRSQMDIVICYIICKNKVLFLRRQSDKVQGGKWTAPGGKKEKNESSYDAICREVLEETGLIIKKNELKYDGIYYIQVLNFCYNLEIFKYHLTFLPEKINLSEHDKYSWLTVKEALNFPLVAEADQCLISSFSPILLEI